MTKSAFIGGKQIGRAAKCADHACCHIHTITRTCGHVDGLHESSRTAEGTNTRIAMWRRSACGDCSAMADQGIVILNNLPVFNNPLLPTLR
jgi:hypothetical protein